LGLPGQDNPTAVKARGWMRLLPVPFLEKWDSPLQDAPKNKINCKDHGIRSFKFKEFRT
jgi:hypothetical protein